MTTFNIKQNDTKTAIKAKPISQTGNAVDLTGAVVKLAMNNGINRDVIISKATAGEVLFVFRPGDTATSGLFKAEFLVVYPDGNRETFPNSGYILVYIEQNLGE